MDDQFYREGVAWATKQLQRMGSASLPILQNGGEIYFGRGWSANVEDGQIVVHYSPLRAQEEPEIGDEEPDAGFGY